MSLMLLVILLKDAKTDYSVGFNIKNQPLSAENGYNTGYCVLEWGISYVLAKLSLSYP